MFEALSGLPTGLPDFVGRSRDIGEIAQMVTASKLVTLTGPSGMGKTRLAIEVAARLQDGYSGGPWFVDLAPVTEPALVAQVVASVLGLDPEPGRSPVDAVCSYLRSRRALLVLDNCERLVEACAQFVERLLEDCDRVAVLATSQQPLGIEAERTQSVTALSLPGDPGAASIESARESEAISFFCSRAAATDSGFRLTDDVVAPIAEICHRLDGIPLAIELAAARVGVMGPGDIAERMGRRFRLLVQGSDAAPERHQTLRAALDWSYDLLGEDEATLFRRLSVFAGGAGLSAVEDVCPGRGLAGRDIIELLSSLVSKSLITVDTTPARPRYHLLETIRAYGRQRLFEAEELDVTLALHATWCIGLAERSWSGAPGSGLGFAVGLVEIDHANVRAAMDWAAGADTRIGLRLVAAMTPFWTARGYLREGREWLRRMLDAVATASARGASVPPAGLRARTLWGYGLLATLQGDVDAARPAVEDSLRLARDGKLRRAEAQALNLLGFISILSQDPLAAKPVLMRSVSMARAGGDLASVAATLALLGRAHIFLGEIDEARAVFEECLHLDDGASPRALIGLGWTALAGGEEERARQFFEQVLPTLRDAGERFETALVLSFVGELSWARGEVMKARGELTEGVEVAQAMGAPFPLARCRSGLAVIAQAEGDSAGASELIEEACRGAVAAHLPYALVRCLHVRGDVRGAQGDTGAAKGAYEEALTVARDRGDSDGTARSFHRLANLARSKGADDAALDLLQEALTLQAEIGNAGLPSSVEALAGVAVDQGRPAHAARLYGGAEAMRQLLGAPRRPDEIAEYEVDVARIRSVLDPAEVNAAWAEGAALPRDELITLALRGGQGSRDPDRPTSGWSSLTPTERQVVDLLAGGMTNREIGERLFMSVRTVQGHLARVFPKLGVKSRKELRTAYRSFG